jgi:hypothetical protein
MGAIHLCRQVSFTQRGTGFQPVSNGRRINMGAYGGTAYASMKEKIDTYPDVNNDGIIDINDLSQLIDLWLAAAGWR